MAKVKVSNYNKKTISFLVNKFGKTEQEIADAIMEQGFNLLAVASNGDEETLKYVKEIRDDNGIKKFADEVNEYIEKNPKP